MDQPINAKFGSTGAQKVARDVLSLVEALNRLLGISDKTTKGLKEAADAAEKAGKSTKNAGKDAEDGSKGAVKAQSAFSKLLASMKRIAFYRAIRAALRNITDGFREGLQHIYQYSAAMGSLDAAHAKTTLDEFATSAMYVKNSLGAALAPVLQSIVPLVNWLANAFVAAANAVNQFFHALKGESGFTKAKRNAVEYADALGGASGAAKELKKQIFGFDELNIFNAPSGGGGGGGAMELDYSKFFEEAELDGIFKKIKERIDQNLGENFWGRFKINFESIVFDWGSLTGEDIAQKALTSLYSLLFGVAGFKLFGPVGAVVGSILGIGVGAYISTIDFHPDGQLSEDEVKAMIKDVAAVITGAVVGWTIGGPGGAIWGMSIAAGLTALIKTFATNPATTLEQATLAGMLLAVVKTMLKANAIGFLGPSGAAVLTITAATALALNIASLLDFKNKCGDMSTFIGTAIANVLNLMAGAAIGFTFLGVAGGLAGAVIGIAVAASLNILINKVFTDYTPQSKRQLDEMSQAVDLDAMYNYLGSPSSSKTYIPKAIRDAEYKAEGGYVSAGSLFYAGEAGPELVGTVGGKTNVTNQDQFTAGMWDVMDNTNSVILQAAQSLVQAIQSKPVPSFQLGDRDIVRAYDRGKTLAGGSLVK